MPRYLITRTLPPLTEEQILAAGKLSKAVTEELGIKWIKSYYSANDGKFYCEYEAPNVDVIYEHGRRAQLPVDSVSMISGEFDPSMFK
jgi:Nickel responsive protein SCO4226-like